MKQITLILLLSIIISCKKNNTNFIKTGKENIESVKLNITENLSNEISIIQLPYIDSTNFDNFDEINKLSDLDVRKLKLKKINNEASSFFLRYQVPFSSSFKSLTVTYQVGEELVTTLINYDSNYNILDKIDIAYDEIADSILRKKTTIEKSSIIIDEINSNEDGDSHNVTVYSINTGKFKLKKQ